MEIHPNWEYVADGVMGGVSKGAMHREMFRGREATVLRGDVSLDNNGGFVQIAFDLCDGGGDFDASGWDGVELDICGDGETYDIRLRTSQLTRPWQSFRSEFVAGAEWRGVRIWFDALEPHRTDAVFDPARLRRIGVLAVGRQFRAEVAVAGVRMVRRS